MSFSGPLLQLIQYITGNTDYKIELIVTSFFAVFVMILLIFPLHECAHGLMAKWLGDDTAERQGRLTLNPLPHIDPIGAFMMFILPIGYAKPVPVNPSRCNKVQPKTAMALTALAGPLSNIIMAYVFLIIYKVVHYALPIEVYMSSPVMAYYLPYAFYLIAHFSLYLAVFNLIPIPPLDGSKILFFFLKPKLMYKMMQYQQMITLIFMMLFFFTDIFRTVIGGISELIMSGLNFLSGFIDILMG